MTWQYAYTPHIWSSVFTIVLLTVLAVYTWQRRSVPAALPFMFTNIFYILWAVGSGLEVSAVDMETRIFWAKFQGVWQMPAVTVFTCFVLEYAWPGRWLTRRNLLLMFVPCLLAIGLLLTNDLHHLLWLGFIHDGKLIPLRGPANWLLVGYAYGLGILNIAIFAWLFLRSPQHRRAVALMLIGQTAGMVLYALDAARMLRVDWPLDAPVIAMQYLMYALALFGLRIFDPISLARQTLIEQMQEGMLVLDPQGRVASLNPAARAILDGSGTHVPGHPFLELVPEYESLSRDLSAAGGEPIEIHRGTGSQTRDYLLEASVLKDWRGLVVGRLLLLHDVTEQRRAQAQLIEQQRALAILQERERLARELHDSLGQVLGYAGFQVEAASKLAADGQVHAATAQLDRLAAVVREAHADVREYILDLHAAPVLQQPFFPALRHYLEGFTHNYNIQTLLNVDEQLDEEPFAPEARMQVFRILQEALSNARKHGQARCIEVMFAMEDHQVRMTVQDDGAGFDPVPSAEDGQSHFGLRFMRERAEALGGSIEVFSGRGQGTRVVAWAPMKPACPTRLSEAHHA